MCQLMTSFPASRSAMHLLMTCKTGSMRLLERGVSRASLGSFGIVHNYVENNKSV